MVAVFRLEPVRTAAARYSQATFRVPGFNIYLSDAADRFDLRDKRRNIV